MRTFGCIRWVVNRMIDERSRRWREDKKSMSYADMSALLTRWKKDPDFVWLKEVSAVPLQQSLRHLDQAYQRFFKPSAGRKAGYPRFLSKRGRQSATFASTAFRWDGRTLLMAKSEEPLDLAWSQIFWGDPATMTISREPDGCWYVSLLVEIDGRLSVGGREAVGIDLGLTSFITDDLGNKTDAPKALRKALAALAKAQRRYARKKKGGKNREKARNKVARIHARVRRIRQDFLHKLSSTLIAENQVICVETLRVAGMIRNRTLALSISDASWSEFVRQLEYKARFYGRMVVKISPWEPSSKTCSSCGHKLDHLDLKVRVWTCDACSAVHDRDVNAAKNIRVAGLAILAGTPKACGADVRRSAHMSAPQTVKNGADGLRQMQEGPLGIRGPWKRAA